MDDSRHSTPSTTRGSSDNDSEFSLERLVEASRKSELETVGEEMEYLYARPDEYELEDMTMKGPLGEHDRTGAVIFHAALRFGIEYEKRYPIEADPGWRERETTASTHVSLPEGATREVGGEMQAVPNARMRALITSRRRNGEREIADEFEYVLAHPTEFESGQTAKTDSKRPLALLDNEASLILHLGMIFGLLYERRFPTENDPGWNSRDIYQLSADL